MFCCLFKRMSGDYSVYGVLDTSDGTVEEYQANVLVKLMRRGIDILGLRVDGDYLSYLGKNTVKYIPNDFFEHNGCVAVVNIVHSSAFGGCYVSEVSIFKQGIGFVGNVLVDRRAEYIEAESLYVDPQNNNVICITFTYTDKHFYGEDHEQDFWRHLRIDTKTCKCKLDKGWKKASR